jgi:hypothetical protein
MSKELGKDERDLLERIHGTLEELLKWTRFEGMLKIKEVLLDVLRTDGEKLAYHYSDGRSSREVAKLAGLSHTTIVDYWKKWATLGLMESINVRGGTRYKRVFSLSDFGIEISRVKAVADKVNKEKRLEIMGEERESDGK